MSPKSAVRFFLLITPLLLCCVNSAKASADTKVNSSRSITLECISEEGELTIISLSNDSSLGPRLTAIALNVALGLFGIHRVYLGTDIVVPIFYTFTLGGGGVLWLFDLACLIFKRNIDSLFNNPNVFMVLNKNKLRSR
jgi:hypothetical protein